MLALDPIPPTKIFQTGCNSGLISQINLQVPFGHDSKILKCVRQPLIPLFHLKTICSHIESFVVGPCYDNLVNIGTCDYTRFHTAGKYRLVMLHQSTSSTPSLFYTVGIVSHSNLVTGNNSHQIYIVPTNLSWTCIAAVMGMFFKNGISFSTLKRKDNSPTQAMSSLGISTPSFSKAPVVCSRNVPLPYDCNGTIHLLFFKTYKLT